MATDKKRYICKFCGVKSVETKMVYDSFWFHLKCLHAFDSGTECNECPELLNKYKKCPYDLLVIEKYSSDFWWDIRVNIPISFELMIYKRHGLLSPNTTNHELILL
jgi:hypothetical protein